MPAVHLLFVFNIALKPFFVSWLSLSASLSGICIATNSFLPLKISFAACCTSAGFNRSTYFSIVDKTIRIAALQLIVQQLVPPGIIVLDLRFYIVQSIAFSPY